MSEILDQAIGQVGDTKVELSALTCAMIAQAEAQTKVLERIATALETLAKCVSTANLRGDPAIRIITQ